MTFIPQNDHRQENCPNVHLYMFQKNEIQWYSNNEDFFPSRNRNEEESENLMHT